MIGFGAFLAFLLSGPAAAEPTAAQVEQEVAACQSRCATDPGLSETDRASCKLNCTSSRRAYQLRTEGIRQESGGTRPGTAVGAQPSPAPTTPVQRPTGGYTTVIEESKSPAQIAACQIGCDQAGLASTDRATCKLNCAATTRIVHIVPVAATVPSAGAATTPGAATSPTGSAVSPAPGGGQALAACFDSCVNLGASDKVTCRLNCEASHRVSSQPAPVGYAPAQRPGAAPSSTIVHRPSGDPAAAAACERSCEARLDLSETDRATCKLGCTRHTTVVVEQWTSAAPASPGACQAGCECASRCLGHQQSCTQSCAGKTGGDAATCSLQCEATFNSCHNACKVDGCGCGGAPATPH